MAEKIVVASGKGGVGKSSCTVAIGKELAYRGYRVLLIDTDTSLRSLDVLLGVSDRVVFDWGDVICERCSFSCSRVAPRRTGVDTRSRLICSCSNRRS